MSTGIEARCSLIVTGESMTPDEITQALGLKATTLWKKGELMNKLPPIPVEVSEWRHAVPLSKPIGHDADLDDFLEYLITKKSTLRKLATNGMSIVLRLYVSSDTVQMVYQLMPGTLHSLAELGMTLEVSSVSWGDVII